MQLLAEVKAEPKTAAGVQINFVVPDKRAARAPIRDLYAAADVARTRSPTALLQQLPPVVMGPGSEAGTTAVLA
jgi:hypothetical protein